MFGLYTFFDWSYTPRTMRASTIHKKVIEASKKSNYGWIAPATELISVCSKKNFPIEYSIDIKVAVLNCFADFLSEEIERTYGQKNDIKAVYYAYNSLIGIENEFAINARKRFLNAFLIRIRYNSWNFIAHHGDSFTKICIDWQNKKLNDLISIKNLDFEKIKYILEDDFRKVIKEAEEKGVFTEDDKKEDEIQRKIIEDSVNYFIETYRTPDNPKIKVLKP